MLRQCCVRAVGVAVLRTPASRFVHITSTQQNLTRVIVKQPFYLSVAFLLKKALSRVKMATPPYNHVTQVGDPVLRGKSAPVDPNDIRTKEFQALIQKMVEVMRKTGGVGLAAPQIGLAQQVFVMEFTEKHFKGFPLEVQKAREMEVVPLRVFVNPSLKILSDQQIILPEGCLSLTGFTAATPRAREVEIEGLNEKAEPVTWRVRGYPARIIQHEYDHLQGTLYIDRMDTRTFADLQWPKWNEK
ncbi:peptide deformylase, mitochondrial-like [Lytechinus variegatus]|uniref:peptide deformylase, mitochondrial-like n=1 Tax=Lytechinus variegatus TaxID=7654 RepID=UPI001BB15877|nr:peptide deformylase, mitochondrial-like [Lytechinus variegatus]